MKNILKVHTIVIRYGKYGDGIMMMREYQYNGKECYSVIISRGGHHFFYGYKAKERAEQVYRDKIKSEHFVRIPDTRDDTLGDIDKYIESLDVNKCKKKINMLKFLVK